MAFIPNHPLVAAVSGLHSTGKTLSLVHLPNFSQMMRRLSTEIQTGGAFHEGEQPLAVIDDTSVEPRGKAQGYFGAMVITDRRVYGRGHYTNVSDTSYEVWFQQMISFTADVGLLSGSINVQTTNGPISLKIMHHTFKKLFEAVMRIPPEHRTMGPNAFGPSPGDDFGAMAASRYTTGAPQGLVLFQLVDAAARAGQLHPNEARSILERTILLDRHVAWGRAMHGGQWLSLLPRPALREVLTSLFGAPIGGGSDGYTDTLDFQLASRGGGSSGLSSAIGIASLAVLGVGWVSFAGQAPPRFLRFVVNDAPCGSAFGLGASYGGSIGRMPLSGARIFAAIHDQLVRVEGRQLLADVVTAVDVAPAARLAQPESVLAERAQKLAPAFDIRAFA